MKKARPFLLVALLLTWGCQEQAPPPEASIAVIQSRESVSPLASILNERYLPSFEEVQAKQQPTSEPPVYHYDEDMEQQLYQDQLLLILWGIEFELSRMRQQQQERLYWDWP